MSKGKGYMLIKVLPGHALGRNEVPALCPPDVPLSAFEDEGAASMPMPKTPKTPKTSKTPKTQN